MLSAIQPCSYLKQTRILHGLVFELIKFVYTPTAVFPLQFYLNLKLITSLLHPHLIKTLLSSLPLIRKVVLGMYNKTDRGEHRLLKWYITLRRKPELSLLPYLFTIK